MSNNKGNITNSFNKIGQVKLLQLTTYNFPKDSRQYDFSKANIDILCEGECGEYIALGGCYYPTNDRGVYQLLLRAAGKEEDVIAHLICDDEGASSLAFDSGINFGCNLELVETQGDPSKDGGVIILQQRGKSYSTLEQ